MAYQPDRDCTVIGRAAPREAATGHQRRQRVILTTRSVGGRYFGWVTAVAGRSLPGQVTSLPGRRRETRPGSCPPARRRDVSRRAGGEDVVAAVPPVADVPIRYLRQTGCPRGAQIGRTSHLRRWPSCWLGGNRSHSGCSEIVGWRDYTCVFANCSTGDQPSELAGSVGWAAAEAVLASPFAPGFGTSLAAAW